MVLKELVCAEWRNSGGWCGSCGVVRVVMVVVMGVVIGEVVGGVWGGLMGWE